MPLGGSRPPREHFRDNATEPIPATTSRVQTVTGNRFPRKCACGCGFQIPRDPEVRYVVDFDATKPYPPHLREHSPDYGSHGTGRGDATAEFFFGTLLLLHQSARPSHKHLAQPEGPSLSRTDSSGPLSLEGLAS